MNINTFRVGNSLKKDTSLTGFTIFMGITCILNILFNTINNRFGMADFKVYYMAADELISGGQVYMHSFHLKSGFYKYSPVILVFFIPFCLLNLRVASVIYFTILCLAVWYFFIIIRKFLQRYFFTGRVKYENLWLSLALLCIMSHLVRELYLGNINILVVLLSSLAILSYISGKNRTGSIFLGIVILAKPYYLILILPLILRKKWKALSSLAVTILSGLLLPFLFYGPSRSITLYQDWLKSILIHKQEFPGRNSLDYIIRYNFFPQLPGYAEYIFVFLACILAAWFILSNLRKEKKSADSPGYSNMNILFEWFLLIALLPNLIKTDWVLFLATAPLITFMIFSIAVQKKYLLIPLLILFVFFYGANSDDLMGRGLSKTLFNMGLIGLGNLLLIMLSLILFLDFRNIPAENQSGK
jgi:hypothetical protein